MRVVKNDSMNSTGADLTKRVQVCYDKGVELWRFFSAYTEVFLLLRKTCKLLSSRFFHIMAYLIQVLPSLRTAVARRRAKSDVCSHIDNSQNRKRGKQNEYVTFGL